MSVETNINFISDLNDAFPRKNDLIKEGDDHIRLIKRVIKNTVPGFNKALSITADKLNLLDTSLTIDGQSITTNTAFKVGTNKGFNANGNRLINLGIPADDTDAVTIKYLRDVIHNITWPINSLYFSEDGINPATKFGFGTWIPWGSGRAIVASGTSTDSTGESRSFISGGTGGAFQRTLSIANMPNHSHNLVGLSVSSVGDHSHKIGGGGGSDGPREWFSVDSGWQEGHDYKGPLVDGVPGTYPAGAHTHTVTGSIDSIGGGSSFEISQPFIVCNVWKRVS